MADTHTERKAREGFEAAHKLLLEVQAEMERAKCTAEVPKPAYLAFTAAHFNPKELYVKPPALEVWWLGRKAGWLYYHDGSYRAVFRLRGDTLSLGLFKTASQAVSVLLTVVEEVRNAQRRAE